MLKIDKIKQLCQHLPEKDKSLALKLIDHRDFDSLSMLITSVIARREIAIVDENTTSDYYDLDINSIMELDVAVSEYKEQLIQNDDEEY